MSKFIIGLGMLEEVGMLRSKVVSILIRSVPFVLNSPVESNGNNTSYKLLSKTR